MCLEGAALYFEAVATRQRAALDSRAGQRWPQYIGPSSGGLVMQGRSCTPSRRAPRPCNTRPYCPGR
eukprot:6133483-Alexandrium_andersonii.AAC.1